jgi:nucleotide-binding universal stress UspA family protein
LEVSHRIQRRQNQAILENARQLVSSLDDLYVISCWEFSGQDFMSEYMDEGMLEQTKEESEDLFSRMSERLRSENDLDDLGNRVQLLNESPVTGIPKFCKENGIDIAVMCGASLIHPLGRKLGSTIERTIGSLPCALLTVKPIGFSAIEFTSSTKEASNSNAPLVGSAGTR